jgi:predicted amidohydrolase
LDVVLRGGRVIDPESGLDAVRDVAVADGGADLRLPASA